MAITLTDAQWERIRQHFPEENIPDGRPGRKPVPTRRVLEAVLWILNTGAQWHMLPQCYPNYKTVHRRFQRCTVHKLRNLERHVPRHAVEEVREDYHRIVYAESLSAARRAYSAFVAKWEKRAPKVATSLQEAGEELLTFYRFPQAQWKALRSTNAIERLNEEFRRRVKTQGSLPNVHAAELLLFGLLHTDQIRMRRIDGWRELDRLVGQGAQEAA